MNKTANFHLGISQQKITILERKIRDKINFVTQTKKHPINKYPSTKITTIQKSYE